MLSGDVFSRYYKIKGFDTIYVSGSDSHGTRMEHEAAIRKTTPEQLVFSNHKKLKKILEEFRIEFDNYTITHNPVHEDFVRKFYNRLDENGYIFTKLDKQLFCNTCKKFLPDRFVIGTCPHCKTPGAKGNQCDACARLLNPEELLNPVCATCGKSDITREETKHWYFDLPKVEKQLKAYVKKHPEWKGNVRNFTERWFDEGLETRCITRDLKWGIPAPFKGAKEKVIYVWAEAVLGYLSAVKQLFDGKKKWLSYWQGSNIKQIHTIGKDNIPFHSIVLPGLLIADKDSKWHLPDQISSTEFLNWIGGSKFSKTNKTGIYVDDALKILDPEYWRFYLLYNRPESRDVDFSWDELEKSINDVLIGNFGNLVNRTLTFIDRYFKKEIPSVKLTKEDKIIINRINKSEEKISKFIENEGSLREALREIMDLSSEGNKFFQQREPWKNEELRANTVYVCARLVKAVSIFLYPYIPKVAKDVWDTMNIKPVWNDFNSDFKENHKINKPSILIQKIDKEAVIKSYNKLKGEKETESENMVSFDEFSKLKLKVGTIKSVEDVENSDKLFKLTVDTGEDRTIVAGVKGSYSKEELKGKQIIVLTNLEHKKIKGIESQGMLLAAELKGKGILLQPEKNVKNGTEIR